MSQLVNFIAVLGFIQTLFLLVYATRHYLFTYIALKANPSKISSNKSTSNSSNSTIENCDDPFISVLLPVYNEKNVIDRLLNFCTGFDYTSYEVIVIDDSIDETTDLLTKWKAHPRVKILHRNSRKGWKGGALNAGIDIIAPQSEYALILDADFVPPKDLLHRFVRKFNDSSITVVQGYQVHDLNAEENWITKGYRVMLSVSYLVELTAKKKLKLLLPVTGSVYMIRSKILKNMQFAGCMTEDWELTLRLYEAGYKISYDPTLMASAECPNTLLKYFRQNMRWAEGHTRNAFRQHFWKILRSRFLTLREKIDFLFQAGVYLNSLLIIATTLGGILALPSLGYALTLPYVLAALLFAIAGLPSTVVASIVALNRENQTAFFSKIPNLMLLGYISTPLVAYASLKGLLTDNNYFHRTYKTGKVTKRSLLSDLRKLFRK